MAPISESGLKIMGQMSNFISNAHIKSKELQANTLTNLSDYFFSFDDFDLRISPHIPSHLVWSHKDVHDVIVEVLESFLYVLLEEVLDLSRDDGVLVVHHVGVVRGVVVLGQSTQLVLEG